MHIYAHTDTHNLIPYNWSYRCMSVTLFVKWVLASKHWSSPLFT